MNRFLYYLICILVYPVALLPFRLIYYLSDMVSFMLCHIFRYRKKLLRRNLTNAFPEKTAEEIVRLERTFYRHFSDYFFETIKMLRISEARMKKHFVFKNAELIQYYLNDSRNVILTMGHYGNWEWVTSINLWVKLGEKGEIGQIYRPLKNKAFDRFFIELRSRFHTINYAKNSFYREVIRMKRAGKNWLVGFISDQKPSQQNIHYWTTFLNQDTPVLTGAERIAKQTDAVVCYLDVKKVRRGFYEGTVKLITDHPGETAEFEITEDYIRRMEKSILRDPAFYLWTHNRWKHKRENRV